MPGWSHGWGLPPPVQFKKNKVPSSEYRQQQITIWVWVRPRAYFGELNGLWEGPRLKVEPWLDLFGGGCLPVPLPATRPTAS